MCVCTNMNQVRLFVVITWREQWDGCVHPTSSTSPFLMFVRCCCFFRYFLTVLPSRSVSSNFGLIVVLTCSVMVKQKRKLRYPTLLNIRITYVIFSPDFQFTITVLLPALQSYIDLADKHTCTLLYMKIIVVSANHRTSYSEE